MSDCQLPSRGDGHRSAVLYIRVSDPRQEEGYSVDSQSENGIEYTRRQRFDIVKRWAVSESAKKEGRKAFSEMVAFVKANPDVKVIIFEKVDRMTRNLGDLLRMYELMDNFDKEIHFFKDDFYVNKRSRSSEKQRLDQQVVNARWFINNLSEEVTKGMLQKAKSGIWPSNAPHGFLNVRDDNDRKIIAHDPNEAPLVRALYEKCADGNCSLRDLANYALDIGLSSSRHGRKLVRNEILRILKNPIYYGDFRWKGVMYRGTHEPIVTKALWDRVQEALDTRHRPKKRHGQLTWAFQGLLRCGFCDCAIIAEIKKGQYIYYHCSKMKGDCPNTWVREEKLATLLGEPLKRLKFDEDFIAWLRESLLSRHEDESQFRAAAVEQLRKQADRLKQRLNSLYVDKLDLKIDETFFSEKNAEWRRELEETQIRIEEHHQASADYMEEGILALELAQGAYGQYVKQETRQKRRLLEIVYSNCVWKDGVEVTFRQPFDLLADAHDKAMAGAAQGSETAKKEVWCPDRYSERFPNPLAPKGSVRTIDLEDPYFFQWQDRKIDLAWGNRPPLLAGQRPVTRRQLAAYKNHVARVFPLDQARRYQAELARPGVRTKVQAAKRLGVPYVRFVQTLSLLELDPRVIEFLDTYSSDPIVTATFSERRLRDLMAAGPEEGEWARFQETLEKARSKSAVWSTLGPPSK